MTRKDEIVKELERHLLTERAEVVALVVMEHERKAVQRVLEVLDRELISQDITDEVSFLVSNRDRAISICKEYL